MHRAGRRGELGAEDGRQRRNRGHHEGIGVNARAAQLVVRMAAGGGVGQLGVTLPRGPGLMVVAGRREHVAYGTKQHEQQGEQHARRADQATRTGGTSSA